MKSTHRVVYTKIQNVNFKDTSYIFVTLNLNKSLDIKPGCYFFICCNNVSKLEWHPLSLITRSKYNLFFCVKNMGENSWSNKLKILGDNKKIYEQLEVYLQGPYQHLKVDYESNKYEYIINIANGIGITPFISILNNISELYNKNKLNKLKKIIFIWIVPEVSFIKPFFQFFETISRFVDIQIFITKNVEENTIEEKYYEHLNIINKKPNIFEYISGLLEKNNIQDSKQTCIISCGSPSLLKDIYNVSYVFQLKLYNESFN